MTAVLEAHSPPDNTLSDLIDLLRGRRVVVLAGAGCSTESGIPDYRGPEGSHQTRKPMTYQEFLRGDANRARYWSRSAVGWGRIARVSPNPAHEALAGLEEAGVVRGIITQNVDGLHQRAGSRRVVDLHGTLALVRCLDCGQTVSREEYQNVLRRINPDWFSQAARQTAARAAEFAPDGDVELPGSAANNFEVPTCADCGGLMKPDVVFFGESVPGDRVEAAWKLLAEGEVLLVVGSSLTVYSGRRFVYRAAQQQMPIAILNLGPTRGDEYAAVKVDGRLGVLMPQIYRDLVTDG